MKKVIQNYRTGKLELADVPVPLCSADTVLVKNLTSLVSFGTERSLIELGQKNLLGKARARPDLVKRFIQKSMKEGFIKTFQETLGRLDTPTPLGYSTAGVVVEAGQHVHKIAVGERVACIGAGYASHAEYVKVPENLCCKMPAPVTFEEASFGMLGIIALHGVRSAKLTFGESVAVIGLGLLGLLTVQILKAYGCRVIGTDIDESKVALAAKLGADMAVTGAEFKKACEVFSSGRGIDAVILTMATKSDDPVNTAVDISRYGGRIVCVGVADIHPQRNEMWYKEVEIVVSKAGGPGTFDPFYENKGIDYPIGYVRWTENRNLEEFLRLVAEDKVDVKSLITHRFKIDEAETVYKDILDNKGGPYIGVLLEYPQDTTDFQLTDNRIIKLSYAPHKTTSVLDGISLGVIGAGLFGKALLLPALKKVSNFHLHTLATSSSANALHTARKYGFDRAATDYKAALDDNIHAVVILTPHSTHAKMVLEALQAGKHVFVEKPLCVSQGELEEIIKVYEGISSSPLAPTLSHSRGEGENKIIFKPVLMVGYNRRFSPHALKMVGYLANRHDPMVINYRVNAGFVPADHWVHSEEEGGSRIIGEICHFVDFMQFLTGSNPLRVFAERVSGNNRTTVNDDNVAITLKFADGSVGNITYSASGDKAFSREQVEVFCEGATVVLTDFRKTIFHRDGRSKSFRTMNQEVGYREELQHFADVLSGKSSPCLTPIEIFYSTQTVFSINTSLQKNTPINIVLPA